MKLKKNIGLIGKMHEGKSSVATILAEDYGYSIWHFAEPVKEVADRALAQVVDPFLRDATKKSLVPGKALNRLWYQAMGARGRAYDQDIWIKLLGQRYLRAGSPRGIVIDDMRFINEAAWAKLRDFVTIRIRRPEEDRVASVTAAFFKDYGRDIKQWELDMVLNQDSETEVDSVEFDFLIENNGESPLSLEVRKVMEGL